MRHRDDVIDWKWNYPTKSFSYRSKETAHKDKRQQQLAPNNHVIHIFCWSCPHLEDTSGNLALQNILVSSFSSISHLSGTHMCNSSHSCQQIQLPCLWHSEAFQKLLCQPHWISITPISYWNHCFWLQCFAIFWQDVLYWFRYGHICPSRTCSWGWTLVDKGRRIHLSTFSITAWSDLQEPCQEGWHQLYSTTFIQGTQRPTQWLVMSTSPLWAHIATFSILIFRFVATFAIFPILITCGHLFVDIWFCIASGMGTLIAGT